MHRHLPLATLGPGMCVTQFGPVRLKGRLLEERFLSLLSVTLSLFLSFVLSFSLDLNKESHAHSSHLQASRDNTVMLTSWVGSGKQEES